MGAIHSVRSTSLPRWLWFDDGTLRVLTPSDLSDSKLDLEPRNDTEVAVFDNL